MKCALRWMVIFAFWGGGCAHVNEGRLDPVIQFKFQGYVLNDPISYDEIESSVNMGLQGAFSNQIDIVKGGHDNNIRFPHSRREKSIYKTDFTIRDPRLTNNAGADPLRARFELISKGDRLDPKVVVIGQVNDLTENLYLRCHIDIDGDGRIADEEFIEKPFDDYILNKNKFSMTLTHPRLRFLGNTPLGITFHINRNISPWDLPGMIYLKDFIKKDPVITVSCSHPRECEFRLGENTYAIVFQFRTRSNVAVIVSYSLFRVEMLGERNCRVLRPMINQQKLKPESPFYIDDEEYVLVNIPSSFDKIVIGKTREHVKKSFSGQIGDMIPEWGRIDLIENQLIAPDALKGSYVVMTFEEQRKHEKYAYNKFRLIADKLSSPHTKLIVVSRFVDYQALHQSLARTPEMNYHLIQDEPLHHSSYSSKTISKDKVSSIMWVNKQKTTMIMDPDGVIVWREEKSLYDALPEIVEFLKKTGEEVPEG